MSNFKITLQTKSNIICQITYSNLIEPIYFSNLSIISESYSLEEFVKELTTRHYLQIKTDTHILTIAEN